MELYFLSEIFISKSYTVLSKLIMCQRSNFYRNLIEGC